MNSRFCFPGKVLPYIFYLSIAYLLLSQWSTLRAQGIRSARSLQIGDTVPDVTIKRILNYKTTSAKISDFKGEVLILDFWATWCSPCVYMIPRMDSLQKQFKDQVQFLAVTSESEKKFSDFKLKYEKRYGRRIETPEVVSDTVLHNLFYRKTIPHYVWIDPSGVVKAVTEMDEITSGNIAAFISKNKVELKEKKDEKRIPYDKEKSLLVNGNGGDGSKLLYHSLLTAYTPGLTGGFSWKIDSLTGRRITVTNCGRLWLYRIAYAKPGSYFDESSVIIETKDRSALTTVLYGRDYLDWLINNNGFCYELIVPASFQKKTNMIMQQDLKNFFPEFSASVENRTKKCLVLKRTGGTASLPASAGGKTEVKVDRFGWKITNASLALLVDRVNQTQNPPLSIVDQTGYKNNVDLDLSAGISDLTSLNRELGGYGLTLVEDQITRPVLVITDRDSNH
ncbi:redoxin domain-containing protein [Dyadobacter psychrotolerans]|uniref:Redoxin domain-containing protein n=1 Tax=Dyadobacter psychrotolerans TaxID=2541721 RepID=A0A4R5DFX3_9BACT|nr:redoxin domain-containing protein [Dyadobacter psychrotolerans]TDE09565.1 redoxin domain-containing protein [Dyadobacter psychrotolerans]